jgi:hypothetical protein
MICGHVVVRSAHPAEAYSAARPRFTLTHAPRQQPLSGTATQSESTAHEMKSGDLTGESEAARSGATSGPGPSVT